MSVRKRSWTTAKGEKKEAWVVDYWHDGKRHIETYDRKKDADAAHAKVKVDIKDGRHIAPSQSIEVAKAAEFWLKSAEASGLERASLQAYEEMVRLHIIPFIGDVKLANITASSVRSFQDRLHASGRSQYMIKRATSFLSGIIDEAVERGLHNHNVVRSISRTRKSRDRVAKRQRGKLKVGVDIPSPQDIRQIIEGATTPMWRTLIILLAFTGIRISEARGLRWKNVDLSKGKLHVCERADRYLEIGRPKSISGDRTVPLTSYVVNTLKAWKLQCPKFESDLVFPSPKGNPYHLGSVRGQCLIAAQGDKVKYTGIHCLRHFYASFCINRQQDGGLGLPPKIVQDRLGHSTLAMTMDVYGHLFPQEVDSEVEDAAVVRVISGNRAS
jgi:integrase